ncbi:MarR family winged helix-turn-helix transcriptional regulator [Acidocella sp.]|uniref:MarR family winged helix-turn-helix transcriptional regulator n=1 Tax=Acidocella sp. TaxID=50710 RepID=UPI0026187E27|nr:MarR family transcriptional regulator [Acidocella sp.]
MEIDFEQDLSIQLHDVARLTRVVADRCARLQGMTRAQWVVLIKLSRTPGLTQREMADALEIEPISLARLIDKLQAAGLVERRADLADRRIWRLHLTPNAAPVLEEIMVRRNHLVDVVQNGMSAELRASMLAGLKLMKRNLAGLLEATPTEETA